MGQVQQAATEPSKGIAVVAKNVNRFDSVLPSHIEVRPFIAQAEAALYNNPDLMAAANSSPESLFKALMECASLGHLPGSKEYYLTPRKNKGKSEILGIEGYRGIVERMYRSGAVDAVIVREVCENDEFVYVEGVHDRPKHVIDWFGGNRGEMKGVYAYAVINGATSRVVILTKDDVMAAKAASAAGDSSFSPWNRLDAGKDHPEFTGRSMWWKTAARRLEPWVPTSVEYFKERVRAAAELNHTEAERTPTGVNTETGEIEGEVVGGSEQQDGQA